MHMENEFAKILAALIREKLGEFMMDDNGGECREVEVDRVYQLGGYISVDFDNGMKFRIIVNKV